MTQSAATSIAAVYSCCSFIADSFASLPVELRNGPTRKDSKPLPLSPLLKRPYAEISARDWWVGFTWALALRGNFYGRIIERDGLGLPLQIKPVHNDAVQIWRDRATGQLQYRFYGQLVPIDDVVHARYQTPTGEVIGLNPIQVLALTFGNAIAKERFVESFYLNSANPMGVIQVPGYLDRVETRKMLRGWIAAHQGLNTAHLPAILTDGAEFKPITISPSDSQLIEALQFSEAQICGRVFRVPPHAVGIVDRTTSWGRGIEQQERGFFTNTLVGYLQIAAELFTGYHRPGQFVHFDTTKRERGATLERAQAGALGMNSGVFLADEVRDWFDLPALPNGDGQKSFMPVNTQLLDMAEETLKQAKQLTTQGPPPQTVSGAQPRPGMPTKPSQTPVRKPSPNGVGRSENGHEMTVEEAWYIVESAVEQARRMQYAADLATRLGYRDED